MAVVVQYIVVRNGVEKMTFATKKEADAHDKMLDIADNIYAFLKASSIKLSDEQNEEISMLLAQERDMVTTLLKGGTPTMDSEEKPKEPANPKEDATQKEPAHPKKKTPPKPKTSPNDPPAATP